MTKVDDSLKQYCKIILTEIENNTKSFQHNYNYFQNKNMLDHQSRKEMIIRKLDELERKQEEIIKLIPNIDESLKYFEIEKKAMEQKQELEKIMENVHKNKPGFVKATEIFHEVNNKEKDLRDFNRKVRCYKVFCEVHDKIDENYKTIEKSLEIIENYDYKSIIKKAEDQNIEDESFGKLEDSSNSRFKSNKSFKLEIKAIEAIDGAENVLKNYKTFLIQQNGNFQFESTIDSKDIIKGKFIGEKVTMNRLSTKEGENSIFFEGDIKENNIKFCFDEDSSVASEKLINKQYMIDVSFKCEKYTIKYNEESLGDFYLTKHDELENKNIRYGLAKKGDKIFLVHADFSTKNFGKVNLLNTQGTEEISGTFEINDKVIEIKS